jgi:hypothetical protein
MQDNISCQTLLRNGESYQIYAADTGGGPINSLQTTARTTERDTENPFLEPIKYYTDSSLATEVLPGTWYNKPVVAVAFCRDTPTNESTACSCAPSVHSTTTNASEWSRGTVYGTVNIGADFLRYTRLISSNISSPERVVITDTAGNISSSQDVSVTLDTKAPTVTIGEGGTTITREITLTATDTGSKIWKNVSAAPSGATNEGGIIYRTGLKANLSSLAFDQDCSMPSPAVYFGGVSEAASLP